MIRRAFPDFRKSAVTKNDFCEIGLTPTTYFWPAQRFQPAPSLPENPFEGLPDDPFADSTAGDAQEKFGAAEEHGLPEDPFSSHFESPKAPTNGKLIFPIFIEVFSYFFTCLFSWFKQKPIKTFQLYRINR